MYSEKDLDALIRQKIKECKMPYTCQFSKTEQGFKRIFDRIKQHIFVRGIANVDTAISLVENELSEPNHD